MKHIVFFILIISMILGSCAPSDSAIQTAISETKRAETTSESVIINHPVAIVQTLPPTDIEVLDTTSPTNGLEIDYAISFRSGNNEKSQEIQTMNVDGSEQRSNYLEGWGSFDWSSDGKQLLLVERGDQGASQIILWDTDTSTKKVVVSEETESTGMATRYYGYSTPRFLSDQEVYFLVLYPRVGSDIRRANLNINSTNISPAVIQNWVGRNGLDISTSGMIVFQTFGNSPPNLGNGLSSFNTANGKTIVLIPIQYVVIGTPSWSPDGEWIAFSASSTEKNNFEGPSSIWIIKKDGSELSKIVPGELNYSLDSPVWSPDGKWIAFSKTKLLSSAQTGDSDIWTVSADGINLRNLTNTPNSSESFPAWYPIKTSKTISVTDPPPTDIEKPSCKPNDPYYASQWNLRDIDLVGALNQFQPGCFPLPVQVGVIDTGVDTNHPDLKGHINIIATLEGIENGIEDTHGHGTSVAGIIGAVQDNDIGIAGIHPHVRLDIYKYTNADPNVILRILDKETAIPNIVKVAYFIRLAVDNNDKVINISTGWDFDVMIHTIGKTEFGIPCNPVDPDCNGELEQAIQYAANHGVLIVAASGNSGKDEKIYPAAFADIYPNVIAVASSTSRDTLATISTTGSYVTIAAPGGQPAGFKCTTVYTDFDCVISLYLTNESGYAQGSGTSIAAPHVTGVVALMISAMISRNHNFSPKEIKNILMCTANDFFSQPTRNGGAGILNASKAVYWAISGITECPEQP